MWSSFLLILFIQNSAKASVFDDIYKNSTEQARLTVCAQAEDCKGVIWRERYVLSRDSCARKLPVAKLVVIGQSGNNEDVCGLLRSGNFTTDDSFVVMERYSFPSDIDSAWDDDLCLLSLNKPYSRGGEDTHVAIKSIRQWMDMVESYDSEYLNTMDLPSYHYTGVFQSDLQMFFITIVLPFAAFVFAFIIFICCFGSNCDEVEYKKLEDENNDPIL